MSGRPLVLLVGDDHRAVGELDLVAGPTQHHVGGGHDRRRQAVPVEQQIPDRDVAHGGPAGGCRQRCVERQRFTDTRPRRHDDHLTGMQPVGDLVEFGESRRHTARHSAAGGDGVDLVHRRLQQILQRNEVLGVAPVGDLVHLGLGTVDHLGDVGALGPGVAVLHHPGAGLHQAAQQRLLGDDSGVVPGVGRGGHGGDQGVQIRRPADALQQSAAVEFGGHRDGVGRLPAPVEIEDGVVDVLVRGAVEVAGTQLLEHVGDGVLAEQHAAEHRLLGGHVLGRLATEILTRGRGTHAWLPQVVDDRHVAASLPPDAPELERARTYIRRRCPDSRRTLRQRIR